MPITTDKVKVTMTDAIAKRNKRLLEAYGRTIVQKMAQTTAGALSSSKVIQTPNWSQAKMTFEVDPEKFDGANDENSLTQFVKEKLAEAIANTTGDEVEKHVVWSELEI